MSVRDQQIEDELRNISITKDSYELWLKNDVTRVFMLHMEALYQGVIQMPKIGSTIEQIAMNEIQRSTNATVLQSVLEWAPYFGDEE